MNNDEREVVITGCLIFLCGLGSGIIIGALLGVWIHG